MKKFSTLQVANIAVTLVTIAVNSLATLLPLNGQTTGEISDRFAIYFVPAGYVFSIWSVIYLGLIAFTAYQALPAQRDNPFVRRIGYAYLVSGVANSIWIFMWHYEVFPLTLVFMLVILASLIYIFLQLERLREQASARDTWFIRIPFSIYLGWISVATVANVTQLLYSLGWNGFGISAELWALIMLVVAAGISIAMSLRHGNIAYVLVFVWAYVGIAVKHWATPSVGIAALALAILIGGTLALGRRGAGQAGA
ncbi:MAG: tryptophan-rich sensory protein [Anaerolineae bacterium]|nr:tryptophan-rich sensory protein [Anaerolineae bacterium]